MNYRTFTISIAILFLAGCQKDDSENVNQDSIYSIYELFYNENDDVTKAQATFRFGGPGGTLLDLSEPAFVTFENDELFYRPFSGVHNQEYPGFVETGDFYYQDLDGNGFTNSVPEIVSIGFGDLDTLSMSESYTFEWEGEPIAENELISLTIDGTQQQNFELFTSTGVGSDNMVLSQSRIDNLGLGIATATLVRSHNLGTVDQGTSEGGRRAVWYTVEKIIYIEE